MSEPAFDIARLHAAYAGGLDPAAVMEAVFGRIAAAADPGIFISLEDKGRALAAARDLASFEPHARLLWAVPFAVKDNIDCAGLPTTAGCPEFTYTPSEDAAAVALLREAGAILIGKTNLDPGAILRDGRALSGGPRLHRGEARVSASRHAADHRRRARPQRRGCLRWRARWVRNRFLSATALPSVLPGNYALAPARCAPS